MSSLFTKFFVCIFLFFTFSIYAQENVTWGGYTISAKFKDKDLFPNFNALEDQAGGLAGGGPRDRRRKRQKRDDEARFSVT